MLMGTAGELPRAPKEKVVFVEDMSDSQLAATVMGSIYQPNFWELLLERLY